MMRSSVPAALVVHPGTQHAFQLADQLSRVGILRRFWTGLAIPKGGPAARLAAFGPPLVRRGLANRTVDLALSDRLATRPFSHLRFALESRLGGDEEAAEWRRNERFQRHLPQPELEDCDVVVGFDRASWILAERARSVGKPFVLDRTAPHPASLRTAWELLMKTTSRGSGELPTPNSASWQRQEREHSLATAIVVASSFSAASLESQGVARERISKIPYGVDLDRFVGPPHSDVHGGLRFLFPAGDRVLKGITSLQAVWPQVRQEGSTLTAVGDGCDPSTRWIVEDSQCRAQPRVAHAEMPDLLRAHDVLVLPTFFDGFGLVLLEAMACGLAVITTTASGGPDLITHGVEGFIIEPGDVEALAASMRHFQERPERAAAMGRAARAKAEQFSWTAYRDRWCDLIVGQVEGHIRSVGR